MDEFEVRLTEIVSEIEVGMGCELLMDRDQDNEEGRWYLQIACFRRDAITGEMGWGYGGKAYLSPHMTTNEIVQCAFGLYKSYWEHESRETFQWNGRRVYGPHISVEALWDVARRVDVRSARHVEDAVKS